VVILNVDDPVVAAMAEVTAARVVRVSRAPVAPGRLGRTGVAGRTARPRFTMHAKGHGANQEAEVQLAVYGDHQVTNALCAGAVALECGAGVDQVASALAGNGPMSRHRMQVTTRSDGVTVIDDAYNANPIRCGRDCRRCPGSPAAGAIRTRAPGAAGRCWERWPSSARTR